MSNVYYHLTTEENAKQILKEGLKVGLGKRCAMVSDTRNGIFLCKESDLAYWKIILNLPVILKIHGIDESRLDNYAYIKYEEYIYDKDITPDKIKQSEMKIDTESAMKYLCYSYLDRISMFTVHCARYYYYTHYKITQGYNYTDEYIENLEYYADALLAVLPNLDYSKIPKEDITRHLKEEGDSGEYTICDRFEITGNKLYVQLIHYPDDSLTEKRRRIYDFIKTTFNDCLNITTGGWCG